MVRSSVFEEFIGSTMRLHGGGYLSAFWFYGDESGIHDGARWCLVCGYVGREDHWREFDRSWRAILAQYSVPDLHANRFFARDETGNRLPPYADWDDDKAKDFIEALIDVLVKPESHLHRLGRGVDATAFRALSEGERRYLTGGHFLHGRFRFITGAPTKPYYLAFMDTYIDALRGVPQTDPRSVMHYMFDQQNVLSEHAVNVIQFTSEKLKQIAPDWWMEQVGPLSFDSREKHPALQAADLATYLWYSEVESQASGVPLNKERALAFRAITVRDKQLLLQNKEAMEYELAQLPDWVRARFKDEG